MKKFDIQIIQVSMYPKKMDIHVSNYPCIQVCMISKYPIIQVSKKNQYPRYPSIRISEKSGIRPSLIISQFQNCQFRQACKHLWNSGLFLWYVCLYFLEKSNGMPAIQWNLLGYCVKLHKLWNVDNNGDDENWWQFKI